MHSFPHVHREERAQETLSSLLLGDHSRTFATSENGFSTLASDIFIVVLMTLWQNHNSCFYPRTFDFILQAASCLLTDSIFDIYPVSANNISKQLRWASCLCHSR